MGRPAPNIGYPIDASTPAARWFFIRAQGHGPAPVDVTTDQAGPYLRVIDELVRPRHSSRGGRATHKR